GRERGDKIPIASLSIMPNTSRRVQTDTICILEHTDDFKSLDNYYEILMKLAKNNVNEQAQRGRHLLKIINEDTVKAPGASPSENHYKSQLWEKILSDFKFPVTVGKDQPELTLYVLPHQTSLKKNTPSSFLSLK
ncbi:12583_t:CDS:2, partial [Dentiscutata erythropus]